MIGSQNGDRPVERDLEQDGQKERRCVSWCQFCFCSCHVMTFSWEAKDCTHYKVFFLLCFTLSKFGGTAIQALSLICSCNVMHCLLWQPKQGEKLAKKPQS
jgi:hypothetical protein